MLLQDIRRDSSAQTPYSCDVHQAELQADERNHRIVRTPSNLAYASTAILTSDFFLEGQRKEICM